MIGKLLCHEIDASMKIENIVDISETIFKRFPNIVEKEINSLYCKVKPLANWSVVLDSQNKES